jgi:peptide/nickel transport system substrate-binding protein
MAREWIARAAAALLVLVMAAGAANAKDLRWANDADVFSMDPHARAEVFTFGFLNNIYEGLVQRNTEFKVEPALAESYTNPEPTRWRFEIRKGVKFHEGQDLTADDVVFSFERAKLSPDMRSRVGAIKEIRRVGDYTVDFILAGPDLIFPANIQDVYIMSKAWCEAHNTAKPYDYRSQGESFAHRNANGTGPFKLSQREPGVKTVLEAFPGWWSKREHNLDKVEFRVISSDATRVAAFLSGEIDWLYSVPPQDQQRLSQTPNVKMIRGVESRVMYFVPNMKPDPLPDSDVKDKNPMADLRVRQAMFQAIDIKAIASKTMRGAAQPTGLMIAPAIGGYDKALDTRLPYDPAHAKALLAEAGYPNGFSLTMHCSNDRYVNDDDVCAAAVGMWGRIGIKVNLIAQSKTRFVPLVDENKTFLSIQGYSPSTLDALNTLTRLFVTVDLKKGLGTANVGFYSNPKLDALAEQIGLEQDVAKRTELIQQALVIVRDDLPAFPLYDQMLAWAMRPNIDMFQPPNNTTPLRYVKVK